MGNKQKAIAVIGDIVGSRRLADRSEGQRHLLEALARVNEMQPPIDPLAPTVGDEFQGLYSTLDGALRATLFVRLHLDEGFDARFGIGAGESEPIRSGDLTLHDGSAWWSAREAILTAKKRESGRTPSLRTWYAGETITTEMLLVNAYLLARDHIVTAMDSRSRRLALGSLHGMTQVELAKSEGITQSAVSRNLQRNGITSILEGAELLKDIW